MPLKGIDLVRMRGTANSNLPEHGEVWRRTGVADSRGGQTETLARVSGGPMRRAPYTTVQSVEDVFADALRGVQGWWVTMEYTTDVRLNDQVRIGPDIFEVVGFDQGRSWHISERVLCREVTH